MNTSGNTLISPTGTNNRKVFLGGSCNPTTWRFDLAIPTLEHAGIPFYNPQQEGWNPQMCITEAHEKHEAEHLFFVIDSQTRALGSYVEVTELICTGRMISLVIDDIPDGTVIDGQTVTGRELKDINRGRQYLRDMVARHPNARLCSTIEEALENTINVIREADKTRAVTATDSTN